MEIAGVSEVVLFSEAKPNNLLGIMIYVHFQC